MRKIVVAVGLVAAFIGMSGAAQAGVEPCSGYPCTMSVSGGSVTYTSPSSYSWSLSGFSGSGTWSLSPDSSGGTTVSWSQVISTLNVSYSGTCYISAAGAVSGNCGPLAGSLNTTPTTTATTTATTPTTTTTTTTPDTTNAATTSGNGATTTTTTTEPAQETVTAQPVRASLAAANVVQGEVLAAVAEAVAVSETRAAGRIITNRIRSVIRDAVRGRRQQTAAAGGMGQGMSGGGQPSAFGGWIDGSYGYQSIDDGASSQTSNWSGLAGFDYAPRDWLIVGLTAGYNRSDVDVDSLGITRTSDSAIIGPYVAIILSPTFTLDGSLQYTRSQVSVDVDSSSPYSGDFDSDRISAAVNITGYWTVDKIDVTAFAGWSFGHETASNSELNNQTAVTSQEIRQLLGAESETFHSLRFGGEASWRSGAWEPFGGVELEYRLTEVSSGDTLNPTFGAGMRYHVTDTFQISGNVSGDPFGDETSVIAQIGGRVNF